MAGDGGGGRVGDGFTVTAGCDKSVKTCKAKFDNEVNFRGFPHVPGIGLRAHLSRSRRQE
jgi:uncharacterized phage protein (TIGR02218 family)